VPFTVWSRARTVEVDFAYLRHRDPFKSEDIATELLRRLNNIPGISLPPDSIARRPSIKIVARDDAETLHGFLSVMRWVADQIRAVPAEPHRAWTA
jgi:hypothetical protein